MNKIYIIDDERAICDSIKLILEIEEYEVDFSTNPIEGIPNIVDGDYAALLLDITMPEMNGFDVIKKIKESNRYTSIIIISAFGNLENAIKATKLGAFDFLEKPIDRDKLLISVRNAVETYNLAKENSEIKKQLNLEEPMLGSSKKMQSVIEMIERVAPLDTRVLISGENGTGKGLAAKAIHCNSNRKNFPFIEVNCAAIPNELIESELFGHEKGSFTGAMAQRIGKFEAANKGTLFLDEIGDMSLQAQAKVLKAIEDGKIERVGGNKKIEVDVRIISATNKNLLEEIGKGNFREDLYHRINVIPITIPSLKDRLDDIPLLVKHFTEQIISKYKKPSVKFSEDAIRYLQNRNYSGNIRELRNIVERILILVDKKDISQKDIEPFFTTSESSMDILINESNSFQEFKEKAEKAYILKQLEANDWNISKTAELLDIQRSHLYNKMKKYGIEKNE